MGAVQFLERQVSISGKNLDLTPSLERHVHEKMKKLERIFGDHQAVTIDTVLYTGKAGMTAEITVHAGGYVLRGESTTSDMYRSINEAVDRIEGQVRKLKTRAAKRLHDGAKPWEAESPRSAPLDLGRAGGPGESSGEGLGEWLKAPPVAVAKTKRFVVKPMDVAEAAMQMELLGHDFFVFTDAETFEVRVLYRRKDGTYGLIEPVIG